MNIKTKALVFVSALILVFSTTACKQSGEAEKPVIKAAETPSMKIESNIDKTLEKADEPSATEHSKSEHPKTEKPEVEHPKAEHPKVEHPSSEHPQ